MSARPIASVMIGVSVGIVVSALFFFALWWFTDIGDDPVTNPPRLADNDRHEESRTLSNKVLSAGHLELELKKLSFASRDIMVRKLVDKAPADQIRHLLNVSSEFQSAMLRDEVQSVFFQRYSAINPKESLALLADMDESRRHRLSSVIFREWSSTDLDAAVEFASSLDLQSRRDAIEGIIQSKQSLSHEALLRIGKLLGHEQVVRDHIAQSKIEGLIDDPKAAWISFLNVYGNNLGSISDIEHQLLVHILRSWVVEIGPGVVPTAIASLNHRESKTSTLEHLLEELSATQLHVARSVATTMLENARDVVITSFEAWAERDPISAFELASSLEMGSTRSRIQRATIESWARSNPMSMLNSLHLIPPEFQAWSQTTATYTLAQTHPELAAREIPKLPDGAEKDSALSALVRNWFKSDPNALNDWAKSSSRTRELVESLKLSQITDLAHSDPQSALNIALEQKIDESGIGLEAYVIRRVANSDVEEAINLLSFARNAQTRAVAYSSVGQVLIQEHKTERALDLVAQQPPEVQSQYFRWISVFWIQRNAMEVYEKMNALPTDALRQFYATSLLNKNSQETFLTSEQVRNLEAVLLQSNSTNGDSNTINSFQ